MILVTGSSGHLGANLVRALLARGDKVRVLVRDDTRAVDGLDVEQVRGDLRKTADIRRAVQGCKKIYHCAAFVSLRNVDRDALFDINVLGTRKLLRAAIDLGVERVVHCSSFGAIGRNPDGKSDESFTVNPWQVELDYDASKAGQGGGGLLPDVGSKAVLDPRG